MSSTILYARVMKLQKGKDRHLRDSASLWKLRNKVGAVLLAIKLRLLATDSSMRLQHYGSFSAI